jgi:hypothetical protein
MMTTEKEYMTFEETAVYVGSKRSTLYNYIKELGIKTHRFKFDKKNYIALADVKRIKEVREKPWLAGPKEKATKA